MPTASSCLPPFLCLTFGDVEEQRGSSWGAFIWQRSPLPLPSRASGNGSGRCCEGGNPPCCQRPRALGEGSGCEAWKRRGLNAPIKNPVPPPNPSGIGWMLRALCAALRQSLPSSPECSGNSEGQWGSSWWWFLRQGRWMLWFLKGCWQAGHPVLVLSRLCVLFAFVFAASWILHSFSPSVTAELTVAYPFG